MIVSEHLAWTSLPDQRLYLNDLMPLPYTEQALDAVAANIDRVQTTLRRPILINPSLYLTYADLPISEPDFLAALAYRTGCGILCDVNNIYVSCTNVGGDPFDYLERVPEPCRRRGAPRRPLRQGHRRGSLLIDDHGSRVAPAVWSLYERASMPFPKHRPSSNGTPTFPISQSSLPRRRKPIIAAVSLPERAMHTLNDVQEAFAAAILYDRPGRLSPMSPR